MKINFRYLLIVLILFTGCGFKVVKQQNYSNFNIVETEINGDKRASYKIKSNLYKKFKDKNGKAIKIKGQILKKKNIKEKNIQNIVTKYEIELLGNFEIFILGQDEIKEITISSLGSYTVNDQHSQTLFKEKELVDRLSNYVLDKLIDNILKI